MNSMVFGIIAFALVQLAFIGASAGLYLRMRSKADAEKASMIPWGIEVKAALGTAQAAQSKVDLIELQHYKNLRSMFEDQSMQIANLKGENATLRKEVEQLTTKVQSLQRMDRHYTKKQAEEAASAMPGPDDGPSELEKAVANGTAIPLFNPGDAPQRPKARNFGRIP